MNIELRTGAVKRTVHDRNGENPIHIYRGTPTRRNAPGGRKQARMDAKGFIYAIISMPRTGKRYRHAHCMRNIIRRAPGEVE